MTRTGSGPSGVGLLARALVQTRFAVAARTVASGSLPAPSRLVLAAPAAVVGVAALSRLLRHGPLPRLAGGHVAAFTVGGLALLLSS